MTDFRTLCADLLQEFASLYSEMSARVDFNETYTERVDKLLDRTSTALAQPELQGPMDEELVKHYDRAVTSAIAIRVAVRALNNEDRDAATVAGLRAVLARWGRPAIEPVPVAERLPGPEDCSSRGYFWAYAGDDWEETDIDGMNWQHLHHHGYTHWLPHHALPLPISKEDCEG